MNTNRPPSSMDIFDATSKIEEDAVLRPRILSTKSVRLGSANLARPGDGLQKSPRRRGPRASNRGRVSRVGVDRAYAQIVRTRLVPAEGHLQRSRARSRPGPRSIPRRGCARVRSAGSVEMLKCHSERLRQIALGIATRLACPTQVRTDQDVDRIWRVGL